MRLTDVRPVVVIAGVPAAGKSTVAELLARRFERGVHVRGDVFRRMVVAGREEMTAEPSEEAVRQLQLRYRLGAETANAYHRASFAVVVQDVIIGPALTGYVAAIDASPVVVVVLAPDPEVVAQREAAREKTAYREGFAGAIELDKALRDETPPIGLWLDTSEQTPDETVDDIVERGLGEGTITS
jgi:cytidylate kinase